MVGAARFVLGTRDLMVFLFKRPCYYSTGDLYSLFTILGCKSQKYFSWLQNGQQDDLGTAGRCQVCLELVADTLGLQHCGLKICSSWAAAESHRISICRSALQPQLNFLAYARPNSSDTPCNCSFWATCSIACMISIADSDVFLDGPEF